MKISELKKIINSVDEDDDPEIVIFVASDHAEKATVVSFDKVNITDCRAELIPSQRLKLC